MSLRQMGGIVSRSSVLVRGFSAKEIAIQNGLIAPDATDLEFLVAISIKPLRGVSGHCAGAPASNEMVAGGVAPYSFTINEDGCVARALVAATSLTTFIIYKRAEGGGLAQIGTITFLAGQTEGVFLFTSTEITARDQLLVKAPAVPDATLADLDFLILATMET